MTTERERESQKGKLNYCLDTRDELKGDGKVIREESNNKIHLPSSCKFMQIELLGEGKQSRFHFQFISRFNRELRALRQL